MRGSGTVALLLGARCLVEAVLFTAVAAVAHAAASGAGPIGVLPAASALFGVSLLLAALLREQGTERRSATILVVTLVAGVAWSMALPLRELDGIGVLTRVVAFGILAEVYLDRILSVARGPARWTEVRNTVPLAALAIALAVLAPGPIDRAPFASLALLALAASGLALSLARTSEELELSSGIAGTARASSATSATVVIGAAAILVAALLPSLQTLLGALGAAVEPLLMRVLYLLVLPFAYLAGYVVELVKALLAGRRFAIPEPRAVTPEQDAEMLRQIEASRPWVIGSLEIIVAAIAVVFAIALFDRMLRERRLALAEGVTLEREGVSGIGLGDTLRALRPRRSPRRRAPRDDGTPAAAVRVAYWRFLALAQARGAGWRAVAETPAEHEGRIASSDPRWRAAAVIVRAFEDLRYGGREPDAPTVERVRGALRTLEAAPR